MTGTGSADFSRLRPTEAEILYGGFLGRDPSTAPLPQPAIRTEPLRALEDVIRPYLQRNPCVVSFSGGRDSSLVLCLAARLAAREGLPAPVPATLHFGKVEGTGEDDWQELVLRHLGLTDRIVLSFTDELEAVGPVATDVLERFGVLSPPNLYLHVPLFEAARGGALLTGVGGDEIFDSEPSRLGLLLSRRTRPRRHDLVRVGVVLAPRPLRERALRHHRTVANPWLRPTARRWLTTLVAREEAAMPERWDRALRTWWASRYVQGSTLGFQGVAAAHDVDAAHPFLAPLFLSALSAAGGPGGFLDRAEVLRSLFAGVLPPAVARRQDKAVFDAPVWGSRVRAFAEDWDGTGIDTDLVDIDVLRQSWAAGDRDYRTLLLLQTAWLAHAPRV